MGLIMDESVEGFETVPLLLRGVEGAPRRGGAVLRRRTARPSRRAVLYVHALDDEFVEVDQATWYTGRAFHFYAADLRGVSAQRLIPRPRGEDWWGSGPEGAGEVGTWTARSHGSGDPDATARDADPAMWDTATFDAVTLEAAAWEDAASERTGSQVPGPRRGEPGDRDLGVAVAGRTGAGPGYPGYGPWRSEVPWRGPGVGQEIGQRAHTNAAKAGRALPPEFNRAAEELGECFAGLDAAVAHVRDVDAIDTVVVAAHCAGALVAALWAHARRGRHPVDALVLANPSFGSRPSWLARLRLLRDESAGWRTAPLLVGARRRIRRGLDIGCPILVMTPAGLGEAPSPSAGWIAARLRAPGRAPIRLGAHVTWLSLDAGLPGQGDADSRARAQYFEELTRWLGAYLSGQIRDQLL